MPDAKNRIADALIGRGLLHAEVVASELRAKLVDAIIDNPHDTQRLRSILAEYEPLLAETISTTEIAAWIAGYDFVAGKLPEQALADLTDVSRWFGPPQKPPKLWLPPSAAAEPIISFPKIEAAARSLWERQILTRPQFDKLTDDAKTRAFTVAYESSTATLEKIRNVLAENIAEGASLQGFHNRIRDEVEESAIGRGHLENVFRTNTMAAFTQGHDELADDPIVAEIFPYRSYDPIYDSRCRPEHEALGSLGIEGTNIYRAADDFWRVFAIPWDYQCRCGSTLMTIEAAARAGLKEAKRWEKTGIAPPLVSRLEFIPFRPRPGWSQRAA